MKFVKMDEFAKIASTRIPLRDGLIIPEPQKLKKRYLPNKINDNSAIFKPMHKISTKEELYDELKKQKDRYKKFLMDMAPKMEEKRSRKYIINAQWRIQTEDDMKNFNRVLCGKGSWEQVKLPHYAGPLGKKTTYYRMSFVLCKEEYDKGSVFICFKGVDYKAHVFINQNYAGSHEGFFAPFEFDITKQVEIGSNTAVVVVENDYVGNGSISDRGKEIHTGDKIYAATGLGYDDPEYGWHHCPPGMGIYQDIYIECKPRVFIQDVFVRPILKENKAEAWIELYNCDIENKEISVELSLYGQNFSEVLFENLLYKPVSNLSVGLGDSLTEAAVKAQGKLNSVIPLYMERGLNYIKVKFDIKSSMIWDNENPWLYQLQVRLYEKKTYIDNYKTQFGMRSFEILEDSNPKGKFLLNEREIKLRGANTMGFEQQCVFKKDWEQLIDDILLAKICNMNFLRLTQRPVQSEVYEYCDKLGLMTQTDLPLFGVLRRNQFVEALRQVEEMEKLIRCHPCNVIISYINEPFPNANNKPHRNLTRVELEAFFKAADIVVKQNNPDRVVKHIDGDYDPPSEGFPDNHCYPCWYNGHGIDIGKLHKGYWMHVKPNWHYGCGEFGAEGLDPINIMEKYYPKNWMPENLENENNWSPNKIIGAQTGNFHYFFYETPNTLKQWVEESHKHQAWATKIMTEAFRRNNNMNTFAIHLFIDAFPAGWMKAIMDVERNPKPAYFKYREALAPILPNIRSDRYKFFEGEEVKLETFICNDKDIEYKNANFHYQIIENNKVIFATKEKAIINRCKCEFQGYISFMAPKVNKRTSIQVQAAIIDEQGSIINDCRVDLEIFPKFFKQNMKNIACLNNDSYVCSNILNALGIDRKSKDNLQKVDILITDAYDSFKQNESEILDFVKKGGVLIFNELPVGNYKILDNNFEIKHCGMLPVHFVSRDTNSLFVEGFEKDDFRLWYDEEKGYITPLLETTFKGNNFREILISGNIDENGNWTKALAVGELIVDKGKIIICQLKLSNRLRKNPVANIFTNRLINYSN